MAAGDPVAAYAYARTGYHRGLDQLRRAGWHGHGPIPWDHEANRGFLRSLHMLAVAAAAIGEDDEAQRCREFLRDSSEAAAAALEASVIQAPGCPVASQGKSPWPRWHGPCTNRGQGLRCDGRA